MPWCLNRGVSNKDIHKVAASPMAFVILTWPSHPPNLPVLKSTMLRDPAFQSGDELLEILTMVYFSKLHLHTLCLSKGSIDILGTYFGYISSVPTHLTKIYTHLLSLLTYLCVEVTYLCYKRT
jgi:hypothetical protein